MHFITSIGVCSLFIFSLLTLSILIPINLKGEKTIAASGDTSTTSLTLSTTSGSAELDLLVTSDAGTFASSTAPLTFSASTNNYTGYTLSIKSATSSTNLTNSTKDANNNTVTAVFTSLSSTNATTKNGITTDTFNSSTYNNQWSFKPSYYNSTANSDKFYPSPDSTGVTLNRTNCANGSSNGTYACPNSSDSYTIEIGARATYAQIAGTYANTYILSAVGNYPEYKITYNDASGESSNLPSTQEISSTDNETAKQTSISFSTTEPTRDGYEFIGWCSVNNSSDPTACSGTTYDPGDTYALDLLSSNTMPLYAIWQLNKVYMQDLMLDQCKVNVGTNGNAVNIGDNITVYDRRDGSDYTVRYINGQCWMTQNLRITGTISGTYSNFSASSFNVSQYDLTNTTYCNEGTSSAPKGYTNVCSHDSGSTSTGVWYNFAAASAGQITGYSNNTAATQDICPANWHLPTGPNTTSGTDYNKLVGNTTSGWQNPTTGLTAFGAVAGGNYNNGSLSNTGSGYWWSATALNAYYRYSLNYNSSNGQFYGYSSSLRYYGYFVRCVRTNTIADATYMQDVTPSMVSKMPDGATATLKDSRDEQDYTVKKIGNLLWMTENLALGKSTTMRLTSADSNIDSTYDLPASSSTGFSDNTAQNIYNSGSTTCSPSSACYGYYTYAAATAGNNPSFNASNYDICPASWHLPTEAEFGTLISSYSTDSLLVSNWNAVHSGYYNGSSLNNGGTYSYYWSSTAYNSNDAYSLRSSSGGIGIYRNGKRYGAAIRCVAKS